MLDELAPRAGFSAEVAVLPITVAALMTPKWVARHLEVPPGSTGSSSPVIAGATWRRSTEKAAGVPVEIGPEDLRDLPRYFGKADDRMKDYGAHDIEILAEINLAPRLSRAELFSQAADFAAQGADLIDLGCEPGEPWTEVGDAVKAMRDQGLRVSIDSFDPDEVAGPSPPEPNWC